jgi:hypothetical protein
MDPFKPGAKSTEFLLTAATLIATIASAVQGSLPPRWAAIAGMVTTAAYAIARAITKAGEARARALRPPTTHATQVHSSPRGPA